jgi:putative GTP pyrophosphokinase
MNGVIQEYQRRYDSFLQRVAANLETHLRDQLTGLEHIDRISARAKSPDRFAVKASSQEDGRPKYGSPLTDIQDQLGARVIVFYRGDVDIVSRAVARYFTAIEERELVPESQWEFGYFGMHSILSLPRDVIPEGVPVEEVPRFFELQIKTLFQHAWSEANHDLGYKARAPLVADQQRRLAFTAAQAWGADRVFDELYTEICAHQ